MSMPIAGGGSLWVHAIMKWPIAVPAIALVTIPLLGEGDGAKQKHSVPQRPSTTESTPRPILREPDPVVIPIPPIKVAPTPAPKPARKVEKKPIKG